MAPYESGISQLRNTLRSVKTLTIENPKQQARINRLEVLTNKRLIELKRTIDLNKEGKRAEALRIILTNRGEQLMDDIRTIIQEVHNEDKELLLVRQQKSQSAVNSTSLSIFMLDVDYFKSINDTYGHHTGDMVLRNLAKILKFSIRNMDYVARYGGEEFIVICPETSLLKAQELAERIRIVVSEYSFLIEDNYKLNLTVSIGVATFPEHALSIQTLMKVTDASMYAAKQSGRNQIKTP